MFLADIPVDLQDTPSHMEYRITEKDAQIKKDLLTANIYTLASKFTNPASWCSSYLHRILSPFLIGEYDACDTCEKEVLARFFHSLKLFVLGPISVPLAGLGGGLRYLAACTQLYSHCLIYGERKEKKTFSKAKVMTWNVAAIGWGMERSHAGVLDWDKRINSIVQKIREINPDVLCLQEVFDTDFCNRLMYFLKNDYATFYIHMGKIDVAGSNSGLFIASKLPINHFEFTEFKARSEMSKWQKKGFASFVIYSDNIPKLQVIATHLQHGENEPTVRNAQLKEILQSQLHNNVPILLVGDLNIEWQSEEFQMSYLATHFYHGYQFQKPTCTNFLTKYFWNATREERERGIEALDEKIDYFSFLSRDLDSTKKIFYPKIQVSNIQVYDLISPSNSLSDHNALVGQIPL